VMAGVKLGLFEALADAPLPAAAVAARCGTHPGATRALLDALAGADYLRRRGEGYELAPVARRWLLAASPASLRDWAIFEYLSWDWLGNLEEFVLAGRPRDVHATMPPAAWGDYQRGMRAIAGIAGRELALRLPVPRAARDLLDIGGGHGHYAALLCRRHPGLRAVVLDLPAAIEHAAPLLAAEGLGARVTHRAGDARDADLGDGIYDVVLIAALAHHFDEATNRDLVRRAARALRPGGYLVFYDSTRSERPGRVGQLAGLFALYVALTSEAGLWSYREMAGWQRDAGLRPRRPLRFLMQPGAGLQVAVKPPPGRGA
ncbi:MAG TPA: class I SAM-dependent methyltransferase, partial [Thermomicrobiales bacterium]|nr:class I SAM-dependent methyltransferase [Thermomicrobiales bacterium]